MRLEELTKGSRVRGLAVDGIATVKSVEFHGSNALEVIFADPKGALQNREVRRVGPGCLCLPKGLLVTLFDRITSDPNRMNGQPCVRHLRLTVRRVLEALATYPDREELFREYPELEPEDIRQVLGYAATALGDKVLELPKSA